MYEGNRAGDIWRLIVDDSHDGLYNMALDWTLLYHSKAPVLRFYLWEPPALSLGWSQDTSDLAAEAITGSKLDVVRRPTGGRAIYHQGELTYSVSFPYGHPITTYSIIESYRIISEALVEGLNLLGLDAEFSRGERNLYKNPSCFASASRYEVLINGKKIIGSAQRRTKKGLLQQGTILLDKTYLNLINFLNTDEDKSTLPLKSISLSEVPDNQSDINDIIPNMAEGFEKKFDIKFREDKLTDEETKYLSELYNTNNYTPFKKKILLDISNIYE